MVSIFPPVEVAYCYETLAARICTLLRHCNGFDSVSLIVHQQDTKSYSITISNFPPGVLVRWTLYRHIRHIECIAEALQVTPTDLGTPLP